MNNLGIHVQQDLHSTWSAYRRKACIYTLSVECMQGLAPHGKVHALITVHRSSQNTCHIVLSNSIYGHR